VQLLDDADNTYAGASLTGSDYLNYVNALEVVPYQQGGMGPVNLAITEQSVYDIIQSIAPSENQAGPFQVNTPSGPTGAIVEIAGGLALAYGAIQGLAQSVPFSGILTSEEVSYVNGSTSTGPYVIPSSDDFQVFGYATNSEASTGARAVMDRSPGGATVTTAFNDGGDFYGTYMGAFEPDTTGILTSSTIGGVMSGVSTIIWGGAPEISMLYNDETVVRIQPGLNGEGQLVLGGAYSLVLDGGGGGTGIGTIAIAADLVSNTFVVDGLSGLAMLSTAQGSTGAPMFDVKLQENLVQCRSSQFALAPYFVPTGVFTGAAADVRNASVVFVRDLSQDVFIQLPDDRPAGTLCTIKNLSTENFHVRINVASGGTIDGDAELDMGNNDYSSATLVSTGDGDWGKISLLP
jgi:hypothetical protein